MQGHGPPQKACTNTPEKRKARYSGRLSELRLVVTDPEIIATRTDKWDPSTETSRAQRDAEALAAEQQDVLAAAQARVDELIG